MWRRVVAGLSAFMLSPGVVVVVAAAYFATAAAANFPPFGPQHAVHSSNSLPQSTAISSHHSGSPTPSPSKCSTGTLTLVGSTAFAPIAQVVGDAYRDYCASAHIVVHVVVNAKDSAQGFTTLRQTEAQNPGNADLMIAMYDGTETSPAPFTAKPVGVLIYAIVANNTDIPESSISVGGLENIFVPPGKQGVVAVGRLAGSGSRKALLDGVFHLKDWGSVPVSDKLSASIRVYGLYRRLYWPGAQFRECSTGCNRLCGLHVVRRKPHHVSKCPCGQHRRCRARNTGCKRSII